MRCVCTIIHQYMTDMTARHRARHRERGPLLVFCEDYPVLGSEAEAPAPPTVDALFRFMQPVYTKAKMEPECIIIAYVYVERLLKMTRSRLVLRGRNWRPILLSCMILASKVWDDLSMWNVDFSIIAPAYTLRRINQLEVALLSALEYDVRVSAGTYAQYYFRLRTMQDMLGLGESVMFPLDVSGAKRLESLSSEYQQKAREWDELTKVSRKRSATCPDEEEMERGCGPSASLEMMVSMSGQGAA